jgi:transcriptional regulator with XRE-family HTH domain
MTQQDKGFDADSFYRALAATVAAREVTWRKVSEETGVSATTLTRMAQGRKPDASSLAVLAAWAGLDVAKFVEIGSASPEPESLAMATMYLRSDPHLNEDQKEMLESMLTSAYVKFRKKAE